MNLDGSARRPFSNVFEWAVVDRVLGRRRSRPVDSPAPRIAIDPAVVIRQPAVDEPGWPTWLGHASWLVQLDDVSLLIDPIFSERIGPGLSRFVPPALVVGAWPGIDAQLVSPQT